MKGKTKVGRVSGTIPAGVESSLMIESLLADPSLYEEFDMKEPKVGAFSTLEGLFNVEAINLQVNM